MSPDWFADEIADLGGKDSAQDLRGKWIIEIGELERRHASSRPIDGSMTRGKTRSSAGPKPSPGWSRSPMHWPMLSGWISIAATHRITTGLGASSKHTVGSGCSYAGHEPRLTLPAAGAKGVSPVSPVAVAPTGDGKASKSAAVTNVTSVTGELETPGAKSAPLGTNAQGAHALDIGARDSADKFENQPVTPVTLVTSAEPLRNPSPVPTGDRHHTGDSTPAWDNLTYWQQRVGAAGDSRDRKAMVVAEWCAATGGRLTDDGVWHLPLDLDDSYAARELKRIAGGLDLLPKATAACIDVNDARPQRASAA